MNWTDIYQNTNWSFFEVVVGVIAIIVSIFVAYHIFSRERKRKSLSYEILANTALFSVHEEAKGRLKILFDRKAVKNVRLLIIKLINNGNIPITSSDFEVPLSIQFDNGTEILSAEISETSEKSLDPQISNSTNRIVLEPFLLNSTDFLKIKILVNDYEKDFELEYRIVGVNKIERFDRKAKQYRIAKRFDRLGFGFFGIIIVYFLIRNLIGKSDLLEYILLSIILFFTFFFIYSFYLYLKLDKKE